MTIKEMFKKIETYNEVAEMVKTDKLIICIRIGFEGVCFENYKSFKKYAKENFVDELITVLTEKNDFTFDETYEVTFSCYGIEMTENVEINTYTA